MKKMHGNATWNTFTPEQKEAIEEWLFVQNFTYVKVRQRCAEKFGLDWSLSAITRTRKHLSAIRALADVAAAEEASGKLQTSQTKAEDMRPSLMKLAATRLLETAMDKADTREAAIYARVLMQGESRDLQRDRLALALKKHEFNASQAALKVLPLVDEFTAGDEERERARIAAVRRILFGPPEPETVSEPETAPETEAQS